MLDSLCSIVGIYSLKRSRLEYSVGRYITPIKSYSKLAVSIYTKIDSNIPSSKMLKSVLSLKLHVLLT